MKPWIMLTVLAGYLALAGGIAAQSADGWYHGKGHKKDNQVTAVSLASADVALEPTHLMLVPTMQVLQKNQYVISFHELSFGIEDNIQLFLCPPWEYWNYIVPGRLWLGGKFGIHDDFTLGVGICDQFYGLSLGLYGVKTVLNSDNNTVYGMADLQVNGDYLSMEFGAGLERVLTQQLKAMGEVALASNFAHHNNIFDIGFVLNFGLRYMVTSLPPLKIDFGINVTNYEHSVWPYIDVSYSSQIR
jgi:hypothetical protein